MAEPGEDRERQPWKSGAEMASFGSVCTKPEVGKSRDFQRGLEVFAQFR